MLNGEKIEMVVSCEAQAELLRVDKCENKVYILGYRTKNQELSLRERLKMILKLIKNESLVLSTYVLSLDNAGRLGRYLISLSQSEKKNTFIGQK